VTKEPIEVVRGSGNVYRDFGYLDADVRQAKSLMAAQIIKILEEEGLSTREAQARTGVAHSEFARIRRVNLARFTIDRLMMILRRLGREIEVSVTIRPRGKVHASSRTMHPALTR